MSKQVFVLNADSGRAVVLENVIKAIRSLSHDKAHVIEISRKTKTRTLSQNAALFGVAEKSYGEFLGYRGAEEMKMFHAALCCAYFGSEKMPMGELKPKRTTTKNGRGEHDPLTTEQFADFFDFIQQHAAENYDFYIPDPDPMWHQRKRFAADAA